MTSAASIFLVLKRAAPSPGGSLNYFALAVEPSGVLGDTPNGVFSVAEIQECMVSYLYYFDASLAVILVCVFDFLRRTARILRC